MKLFRVNAKNDFKWSSDGAISAQFFLLADDLISAVMKADEVVTSLKERITSKNGSQGLRVCSIQEEGDIANGVVMLRSPEDETWLDHAARVHNQTQE
jgi:hypothetical protein